MIAVILMAAAAADTLFVLLERPKVRVALHLVKDLSTAR
jgi:hypothetical protein